MKKSILLIIGVFSLLTSCQFSQGVKKDLSTGLSTSYKGFAIEDVYLAVGEESNKVSNNQIALGDKVMIVVTGVDNYTVKEGKVFPGCTIILTDKSGKEILNLPDAFENQSEGQPQKEASTLRALVTTGDPMVAGETYHLKVNFFDKLKKESTIASEVDVVVK